MAELAACSKSDSKFMVRWCVVVVVFVLGVCCVLRGGEEEVATAAAVALVAGTRRRFARTPMRSRRGFALCSLQVSCFERLSVVQGHERYGKYLLKWKIYV
jgi:hypothetical protein